MNGTTAPVIGQSPAVLDSPEVSPVLTGNAYSEQVQWWRRDREYLEFRLRLQGDLHRDVAELIQLHQAHVDRLREKMGGLEMILDMAPPELQRDPKRVARWIAEQRGILPASPDEGTTTGVAAGIEAPHTTTAAPASEEGTQGTVAVLEHHPACTCFDCGLVRDQERRRMEGNRRRAELKPVFTRENIGVNPNAAVSQPYPKGKFASREKGGV